MSTSTIFIKQPLNYRQSLALITEKYKEYSPALSLILWTFSGLYAASQSNFNHNISGITLAFSMYNLLLMFLSSISLLKGLKSGNILLLLPWISITIYTLYYNHYEGLVNTLVILKRVKKLSWVPWGNLIVNIILLIIRVTLTIRVFQLCVHLWFKKKLSEMREKQF